MSLQDSSEHDGGSRSISSESSTANDHDRSMSGSSTSPSASGKSSTTGKSTTSEGSEENFEAQLTAKKTKDVNRLRFAVIAMLFMAAIGVSLAVFIMSRRANVQAFEIQYEGNVFKILDAFQDVFEEKMIAISGLAQDATAHSEDHFATWPYMTLSNFHGRAGNARKISNALYISISHFINSTSRQQWEEYVQSDANVWIDQGHEFQKAKGMDGFEDPDVIERSRLYPNLKVDPIHYFDYATGLPVLDESDGPYMARWETSPVMYTGQINENIFLEPFMGYVTKYSMAEDVAVLSEFITTSSGSASSNNTVTAYFAALQSIKEGEAVNYLGDPIAYLVLPVYDRFDNSTRKIVATMKAAIHWKEYFKDILPPGVDGMTMVLENACSGNFTYEIQGEEVFGVGPGDIHDDIFDEYEIVHTVNLTHLEDGTSLKYRWDTYECPYTLHVFPSQTYYRSFISGDSVNTTFAVGMVFFYTIVLFVFYDRLVESRQRLILAKATKSTAIVASLFPKNVRDRLLKVEPEEIKQSKAGILGSMAGNQRLKTYLGGDAEAAQAEADQPIADLFPHCTAFFADIAGFTAWSSTREPAQVFVLLQAVYQAFDALAKRRRVFKVETIGDSYVAVTGLPEPQRNHAVIMSRFAWDCFLKFSDITKELEVSLGPDTGDLGMRYGLHSGPVTAGVLKGDRARFQLFGDTVNTAARMESTGVVNRIQISSSTAEILVQSGKHHWVTPRDDTVKAKGKGVLKTFWLSLKSVNNSTGSAGAGEQESALFDTKNKGSRVARRNSLGRKSSIQFNHVELKMRNDRRIDWIVEMFSDHIKKIVAVRNALKKEAEKKGSRRKSKKIEGSSRFVGMFDEGEEEVVAYEAPEGTICLDEVQKAMNMQQFNALAANAMKNEEVTLDKEIIVQLREYVTIIASSYNDNPFHNFAHACHVTMSVHKLLQRIAAPDLSPDKFDKYQGGGDGLHKELNDFSHGIIHDPMALFAITFSALIHDVDHRGVSNVQLSKEMPEMAEHYRYKSVAEQNSVDVAWDVLMLAKFEDLRKCIFETKENLMRFRQLIVNTVLATDIFDKELNDLRKLRWSEAFSESCSSEEVENLRATIVIEHIIQASDVSHTMQHWHVYQKWNKCLFKEMHAAYKAGRMGSDPSTFWYNGELSFFDNYVIPLAKKLKECNVFGVSSDEYLSYAQMNREEWQDRGKEIVEQLIKEVSS